jgi:hypothetical protein
MEKKTEVKVPLDAENSLLLAGAMGFLGIGTRVSHDNGMGSLSVFLDEHGDEAVFRLWHVLSDLRVRYIEAKQAEKAEQMSYLEGDGAPV